MSKTYVTLEDMRTLLETAEANDTIKVWTKIALQWMEGADEEVKRLREELSKTMELESEASHPDSPR